MKRCRIACLTLALAAALALCAPALAVPAPRGYVKGLGYAYFSVGSYPQGKDGEVRPLLWRSLDVTDGRALLMTEHVIDAQQVIFESDQKVIKTRTYRRIASFADSDLCAWMNNTMLPAILGNTGLAAALVPGDFGKLYPLTDDQFLTPAYGFSTARYGEGPTRLATVTPYAAAQGVYHDRLGNAPYWVAAVKDPVGYKLQIVGYNGHLSYGAYTRVNIGLRPAMLLDLNQCDITGGDGTEENPWLVALRAQPEGAAGASATATPDGTPTTSPNPQASTPAGTGDATGETATAIAALTATPVADASATAAAPSAPTASPVASAVAVPSAQAEDGLTTLSLIGDVSVGDAYQYRLSKNGLTEAIRKGGMGWAFARVRDVLSADDLTAANLEVCLTNSTDASGKTFPLLAPPEFASVLTEGGIDTVNTVNNHCFDFGAQGYADTLAALEGAGIGHFGTLVDGKGNASGVTYTVQRGGIRFGFAGYSYPQNETLPVIERQVGELRAAGCDVVIVSLHWGRETFMAPKSGQPSYAAKIIDMGADAVWGHHPHVLQPVQFYKGKPVLFSTGNFIFGTMSKVEPSTGIFQLAYERTESGVRLKRLTVVPCMTQRSPDYQPYVLTDEPSRRKVWAFLRAAKTYEGYVNLPEAFLETGVVELDAAGEVE